jgi:hypothetical protein
MVLRSHGISLWTKSEWGGGGGKEDKNKDDNKVVIQRGITAFSHRTVKKWCPTHPAPWEKETVIKWLRMKGFINEQQQQQKNCYT